MKAHYAIENGRILRNNPFCPRCGEGVFMADKGEWWSCGKCGDRYSKKMYNVPLNAKTIDEGTR